MGAFLFIVAAIVVLFLYSEGRRIYQFFVYFQRMNKIPGPKSTFPFFGLAYQHMKMPKEDRLEWFKGIADQHEGGIFKIWVALNGSVFIHRPEHIEIILRSNTHTTKATIYHYLTPWLGRGLLTANGPHWFRNRKLIKPVFHVRMLKRSAEVMLDKAKILISCIEQKMKIHGERPFDVFVLNTKYALDVVCENAMGTDLNVQRAVDDEYMKCVHNISALIVQRFFNPWLAVDWIYYKTVYGKSFKAAVTVAKDFCTRLIEEKLKAYESGDKLNDVADEHERKAFMDLLLDMNRQKGEPLTMTDIRDEANTFMGAGHETTAATMSWALFCLGNELDVQKKVQQELDQVLADTDDHTIPTKLSELKCLERVIKETLRLYPSVAGIGRKITEDVKIGDYTVPAGADLNIDIYQLHRDPSVWEEPLRFNPDRFLSENFREKHPYAYIPFSAGPRNCIGQKYSMIGIKIALALILRQFNIESVEKHSTVKKYSDLILRPVDGMYLRITKRSTLVD